MLHVTKAYQDFSYHSAEYNGIKSSQRFTFNSRLTRSC